MNSPYDLPSGIEVNGREYRIRTDFRAVLDVLISQNDPELDDNAKAYVMLKIMIPEWRDLKQDDIPAALRAIASFIDCGYQDSGKPSPKLVDWEQDAPLIIPAVNKVAGFEVRQSKELHWWTFFSYYMEIRESLFSEVVNIRSKKARHKKLEKYEQEFYRENKALIDFKGKDTEEKNQILDFLKRKEVEHGEG